jgi:hypothetical protein
MSSVLTVGLRCAIQLLQLLVLQRMCLVKDERRPRIEPAKGSGNSLKAVLRGLDIFCVHNCRKSGVADENSIRGVSHPLSS